MAQQVINIGAAANDRTGDTWRAAMQKVNDNTTELYGLAASGDRVIVNEKADLPTPAAGVITLAAGTEYLFTESVALGTDRIVFGDSSSIAGIDNIITSLTYSGTGDMLTFSDVSARVANIALDAPLARIYNWTDTTTKIGRFNDVTIVSCNKVGIFNGTSGVLRFTNHTPSSITSDGLEFTGNFRSVLYDVAAATIAAGSLFNLGTATFDSFILETGLITLNGTSFLLSGAAGSANINTGGSGTVRQMRLSGTGTPLNGITVDDALWTFSDNDDIADTRPNSLISMQGNATETVITVIGTPVLVAGTWVVENDSQFTATTAGRMTYTSGKPARLPIDFSCSIEPVSGTNISLSTLIAINGSVVSGSQRDAAASAADPVSVSSPWAHTFSTGDYVEVFVQNNDTTSNIIVSSAIGRVN